MTTRSVDIFDQCLVCSRKKGRLVGADIFKQNYNFYNFLTLHLIFHCFSYTFVTIYCALEFKNKLAFCLVTYGFGVQVRNDKKKLTIKKGNT